MYSQIEEMSRARYGRKDVGVQSFMPSLHVRAIFQTLPFFHHLGSCANPVVMVFMEASLHSHDRLMHWPLVIKSISAPLFSSEATLCV